MDPPGGMCSLCPHGALHREYAADLAPEDHLHRRLLYVWPTTGVLRLWATNEATYSRSSRPLHRRALAPRELCPRL